MSPTSSRYMRTSQRKVRSRACLRSLTWQRVCRRVYIRSNISWGDADMPLRDMGREQMWMLPPTLDELLSLDHPARFVAEFVDALGRDAWAELGVDIDGDVLGAPAYHPRALLGVWLYGFMTGVRSCRKAGGGLPGSDTVPVADRVAAS